MRTARTMNLQDLMIMVAATAVGLALSRVDIPLIMRWEWALG